MMVKESFFYSSNIVLEPASSHNDRKAKVIIKGLKRIIGPFINLGSRGGGFVVILSLI
jgi:hypothetical protein